MARLNRNNKEIPARVHKLKLVRVKFWIVLNTLLTMGLYISLFRLDKLLIDYILKFYK